MNASLYHRRLIAIALGILSLPSLAWAAPLNLTEDPVCEDQPAYKTIENLLFLDRTTNADQAARDRYQDGIAKIFQDRNYAGRLTVEEVRENEVEAESLGEGCLDALNAPKIGPEKPKSIWDKIADFFLGIWHMLFHSQPTQDEINSRIARAQDIQTDRESVIEALSPLILTNHPTDRDTEITQSLVAAMQNDCSGRRACNVFLYSDLLDSDARRFLEHGDQARQAGRARANALLREYHLDLKTTVVMIQTWGFGRADAKEGSVLTNDERTALRAYWEGFFDTIQGASASGSSSRIAGIF